MRWTQNTTKLRRRNSMKLGHTAMNKKTLLFISHSVNKRADTIGCKQSSFRLLSAFFVFNFVYRSLFSASTIFIFCFFSLIRLILLSGMHFAFNFLLFFSLTLFACCFCSLCRRDLLPSASEWWLTEKRAVEYFKGKIELKWNTTKWTKKKKKERKRVCAICCFVSEFSFSWMRYTHIQQSLPARSYFLFHSFQNKRINLYISLFILPSDERTLYEWTACRSCTIHHSTYIFCVFFLFHHLSLFVCLAKTAFCWFFIY